MTSLTHPPGTAAPETPVAAQTVLTEEMLVRFAKRAPQYDRDNVFFSDDFDELGTPATCALRSRRSWAAPGCRWPASRSSRGDSVTTPRRRRWRSTCTCTGPAPRPTVARRRHVTALAARSGGRRSGVRRRPCRERQRHPDSALDDEGSSESKAAIGSRDANRLAVCRRSGRFSASMGWTRRSLQTDHRPRLHAT